MENETGRNIGLTQSDRFKAVENLQEIRHFLSINPVNLHYCGEEQCESGYSFGPFVRTNYVIHFVTAGKGMLWKKGKEYEAQAGQAFLISPGEEVTYRADLEEPWCYMWIGFHGPLAEEILSRTDFSPEKPVMTCPNLDRIRKAMKELLACEDLDYADELLRTGILQQILGLLLMNSREEKHIRSPKGQEEGLYVQTALSLLIDSDNPQIKVEEVAKAIGISRGYLSRIFRQETGLSPQEFQHNYRMEKAGDLLRYTRHPVSLVAEKLGYADVLSFSKSFRRFFGVSPTAFREQKVVAIRRDEKGTYTSSHPL